MIQLYEQTPARAEIYRRFAEKPVGDDGKPLSLGEVAFRYYREIGVRGGREDMPAEGFSPNMQLLDARWPAYRAISLYQDCSYAWQIVNNLLVRGTDVDIADALRQFCLDRYEAAWNWTKAAFSGLPEYYNWQFREGQPPPLDPSIPMTGLH